ncbi:MAG: type II secretion system F family protein [Candidatus Velamenicoccus archaeovorus]
MSRRLPALGLIGAFLLLLAGPAAAATTSQADIRKVDAGHLPEVAVTISLPGQETLASDEVTVTENGESVPVLSVQPLTESAPSVDVVLAFDLSASMAGVPRTSAIAAARQFVQGLPAATRVGLLTFNDQVRVVTPITDDHAAVLSALAKLPGVHPGTALFGAVTQASSMFSGSGQHNVVLLANGPNNVGDGDLLSAVEAATSRDVTIFSVGFRGGDTDVQTMVRLADGTGGTYQSAQTARLDELYARIATQISDQFVVTYRSSASPGDQLNIEMTAAGSNLNALALVPKVKPKHQTGPVIEEVKPLLGGTLGLAVAVLVTFVAAFLLFVMLIGTGSRVRRERRAAMRMKAVASPVAGPEAETRAGAVQWIPQQMVQVAERVVEAGGFGATLDHRLEQAGFALRSSEFITAMVGTGVAGAVLAGLLFQSLPIVLVATVAGASVPWFIVSYRLSKRAQKLDEQLPEVLNIMASSLRAGHSFLQALDAVSKEIPEPAQGEFMRTLAEIRLGRPLDEALNAMAERVGSESFRWAVLAVNIQREVGGNLAEILDTVAETVRERQTLRREVHVLTTEGRLSMYILTALPLLFALYLFTTRRDYVRVLYTTRVGVIMLITAGALLVAGFAWFRKIVRIDV